MLKYKVEANSVTLNGRRYGKLIENCPPNMKPTIFGMAVKADYSMPDDYNFLVQYEPPQPLTNADRIRQMSDEELATFFGTLPCCPPGNADELCFPDNTCGADTKMMIKCWANWLKSPVEVDNGT